MSQTDVKQVPCDSLSSILFLKTNFLKMFSLGLYKKFTCEKYTSENEAINLVIGGAAWSQTQINKTLLSLPLV